MQNPTQQKMIGVMIEDYFRSMQTFCGRKMSRDERKGVVELNTSVLYGLLRMIQSNLPPEQYTEAFRRINNRFLWLLVNHDDSKWLWKVFQNFSDRTPPHLLN